MESWTANEAARNWGISPRRVSALCTEGRVPGAEMFGNSWAIPKDSAKPDDARTRSDFDTSGKAKPFVKWAGGKGQLIPAISDAYPQGFGDSIKRYAEPFVGGGAVLFDVLNRFDLDEVYISDINRELVGTYRTIRDRPDELIEILARLQNEYISGNPEERKAHYLEHRKRFNETMGSDDAVETSALFIYLNKTCFNGLYRVNSGGKFNVPSGVYKNPKICDPENIALVSERLQIVDIELADFRASREFVDADTFVYFDPPYRPLTATSAFTSYTDQCFDDDDQRALAEYFKELTSMGARVAVSNSDPHNVDPDDDFFEDIYEGATITRVAANRMINSKGSGRGKISELLITNYGQVGDQRTLSSYCADSPPGPSAS